MSMNSFVAFVPQQHNTRGQTQTQGASEQGRSGSDALRLVWAADAFLWLVALTAIMLAVVEQWFGVFSGFTLLVGPTPALLLGVALMVGGAAYLASTTRAGDRLAQLMAPVRFPQFGKRQTVEATAPQWKVRTTPQRPRATASQRVMDMEL